MTTQAETYLKATAARRRADMREGFRSFLVGLVIVAVVLAVAGICAAVVWWMAGHAAVAQARTKAEIQAIQAAGNAPAQVAPVQAPIAVDPALAAPKFTVVETTVHGILFYVLVTEKGGQVSTCLLGAGVTQFAVPLEGDPKTWKDQLPKHGEVRTVAPGDTK